MGFRNAIETARFCAIASSSCSDAQPSYGKYVMVLLDPSLLRSDAFLSPLEIDAAVTRALDEDLGRAGDVTSIATIPEDTRGRAVVVARKPASISGLPLVAAAFRKLRPTIEIARAVRATARRSRPEPR